MNARRRATIGTAATLGAAYVLGLRRRMLRWGATHAEASGSLPGDEVVPRAALLATRAVDIAAPPSRVWPWLVQLGYGPDRAGFYSYDWLENLIGLDIHSATKLNPGQQRVTVGQRIPFGADTDFRVEFVQPGAALVLHVRMHPFTGHDVLDRPSRLWLDWTWTFALRPHATATRLLVRTRGAWSRRWVGWLMQPALEPVHFLMERRMLLGIRSRAERNALQVTEVGHDTAAGGAGEDAPGVAAARRDRGAGGVRRG